MRMRDLLAKIPNAIFAWRPMKNLSILANFPLFFLRRRLLLDSRENIRYHYIRKYHPLPIFLRSLWSFSDLFTIRCASPRYSTLVHDEIYEKISFRAGFSCETNDKFV